jgi:hypothetical protein
MLRFGLLVPGLAIAACLVLGCDDGENRKDAPAAVPGERGAEVSAAARSVTRKWRAFKTLVVLEASDATLRVARGDRSSLLLGYDPVEFRGTGPGQIAFSRSDGQAAVRFTNCTNPRRDIEFPGALLARRPGCYRLEAIDRRGTVVASGLVNIARGKGGCTG